MPRLGLRRIKISEEESTFIKDIQEILEKHDVYVGEYDNYSGNEAYCGTDYYFIGTNIRIHISKIENYVKE